MKSCLAQGRTTKSFLKDTRECFCPPGLQTFELWYVDLAFFFKTDSKSFGNHPVNQQVNIWPKSKKGNKIQVCISIMHTANTCYT